jgi:hypothetical protein
MDDYDFPVRAYDHTLDVYSDDALDRAQFLGLGADKEFAAKVQSVRQGLRLFDPRMVVQLGFKHCAYAREGDEWRTTWCLVRVHRDRRPEEPDASDETPTTCSHA